MPNAAPDTIERVREDTREDTREDIRERVHEDEAVSPEFPWVTIVWDDPINLMSYVTYVFQKLFQFPKSKAEKLMMDVHSTGKAVVTSGTREEMERDVTRLHGAGLWATLQHDR